MRSPAVVAELDYALRPDVHERRVPSFGAVVDPRAPREAWGAGTGLAIAWREAAGGDRRFADGLSSFLVRDGARTALAVFDRPAGSERDLVVLSSATGAAVVQRHPSGVVRLVADAALWRWNGLGWHHEPPVRSWIDTLRAGADDDGRRVLPVLLAFAVHDLGARNVGALLVYRRAGGHHGDRQARLAVPPPLDVTVPADLAPLRHVLAQTDGAAVFDAGGVLRELGVRLVPTPSAEATVDGYRGMRHTAARRYSFDDPDATVVAVSEDGPVTVLRDGAILGRSQPGPAGYS